MEALYKFSEHQRERYTNKIRSDKHDAGCKVSTTSAGVVQSTTSKKRRTPGELCDYATVVQNATSKKRRTPGELCDYREQRNADEHYKITGVTRMPLQTTTGVLTSAM